ncbi:serine hydrolase [Mucilaginibacter celer]|uniref:Serine hydrolase n=1 Tax=Mucilaginibacter celer TaxID=2305508 RepID=A0A494W0P6_9SPHI|nr:serine hydrolase [Mucilaginibacter celer]AYL97303.1 serine hydrolase [Mucilaginibacter celer]
MALKHIITALLLINFFIPAASRAQGTNPDSIDTFVSGMMQRKSIPALQMAVVRQGKIIKLKTYGTANLENNIPATDKSIFSINSITKAFTGVAVMQLAEEGKLKVTDPLSMYLDSLPAAWQKITLQQVLTHISGLPDVLDENEQVMGNGSEKLALQKVGAMPMEFNTGDKFSYNQTGYVLIGKIITKLSGMHFTKFIEERQFKVAGMPLTRFGDSYDVVPNSAGAYTMTKLVDGQFVRNKKPGISYIQFPLFFRTAAGILSTAGDMGNWVIALKTGKLLKNEASIKTMWTPAVLNNGNIGGFNSLTNGYALGWPTVTRPDHPAVGPVGGGRSAVFIYLKDDLSIVVLTNLNGGNPDRFIDEIAGYYIPDMHEANGFGLSPNLKKLRGILLKQNFKNAEAIAAGLKKKDASFTLPESELNGWGYQLLSQKKPNEALAVFTLNTALYPNSANAFDSYGEALEFAGEKDKAVVSYKKSLQLNADNKNAAERIKALSEKQ